MTEMTQSSSPHRGVLVLVLGILSIVICQLTGPVAWILGKGDLAKMNEGQMDSEGRGLTKAGMICGIIGTVLLVLGIIAIVIMFIFGIGLAAIGASAAAGGVAGGVTGGAAGGVAGGVTGAQ